jgi:hypothetical protein
MASSSDDESQKNKSVSDELTHIDFGDVSDLKSITSESPKPKTGEFPLPEIGKKQTGEAPKAKTGDPNEASKSKSGDLNEASKSKSGDLSEASSPKSGDLSEASNPKSGDLSQASSPKSGDLSQASNLQPGAIGQASSPKSGDFSQSSKPNSSDIGEAPKPSSGDFYGLEQQQGNTAKPPASSVHANAPGADSIASGVPIRTSEKIPAGIFAALESEEEAWPAGKAGAAGKPLPGGGKTKPAASKPSPHDSDRLPEDKLRDERPVGIDPDEDYELVTDTTPFAPEGDQSFWAQSEMVFPGCLGNKISARLDPDIWEWFKAQGDDWEDRVNDLLRRHMEDNQS